MSELPEILDPWREVIHPAALILPRPSVIDYQTLKNDITANGILTPLTVFVDVKGEYWLLDGLSRLQILLELKQPVLDDHGRWAIPTTQYYEAKGDDPYTIVLSLNVSRRHLTPQQRREAIAAVLYARPDLSDRAVARVVGVSPATVANVKTDPDVAAKMIWFTKSPVRRELSGRIARGAKPGGKATDQPTDNKASAIAQTLAAVPFAEALDGIVEWYTTLNSQKQRQLRNALRQNHVRPNYSRKIITPEARP